MSLETFVFFFRRVATFFFFLSICVHNFYSILLKLISSKIYIRDQLIMNLLASDDASYLVFVFKVMTFIRRCLFAEIRLFLPLALVLLPMCSPFTSVRGSHSRRRGSFTSALSNDRQTAIGD